MVKSEGGFFLTLYLKEFLTVPKEHLDRKQLISFLFGRLIEMQIIGVMWVFSKIPFIGVKMERVLAQKLSRRWNFRPIPNPETLSNEARQFKQEKTLAIGKQLDVQTKILDITTFNEIIDNFPFGSVAECGCRSVIMNCDCPTHTCLTLRWPQKVSDKMPDGSKYQKATREELEKVIDLADKYALVHMVLTYPDKEHPYVICNCCDCCCVSFRQFKAHAIPMIVGSEYVARVDINKCNGCFYCVNYRCRFQAILKVNEDGTVFDPRKEDKKRIRYKWPRWSEKRHGWGLRIRMESPRWKKIKAEHAGKWLAKIDPNRCFGCGNCSSPNYGCPEGAIQLYHRKKL